MYPVIVPEMIPARIADQQRQADRHAVAQAARRAHRSPAPHQRRLAGALTLIKSAAGFVLLAVLAAGCGTAVAQHAPAKPAAAAAGHLHRAPVPAQLSAPPAPPATSAPAHPANPIPQGNGGDHDGDNNAGPSDGDGDL